MEKPVGCMGPLEPSSIPDVAKWTFIDALGMPVADSHKDPTSARLSMAEVGKILSLAKYVTLNLTACNAISKAAPPH